jgi:4'-phosphopantetheinyl transferase
MRPILLECISEMFSSETLVVWRLPLNDKTIAASGAMESSLGLLSAEEKRRALAFKFPAQRGEYVAAHVGLRVALGRCLQMSPASVPIDFGIEGGITMEGLSSRVPSIHRGGGSTKPGIVPTNDEGNDKWKDIRFNLSHTAGLALVAVGAGIEVGVDVERLRPMDDLEAMANSVMSEPELLRWNALLDEERLAGFYRVWTRKEAYLKAIGLGLSRSLQDITVPVLETTEAGTSGEVVVDRAGKGEWRVRDVAVEADYSAAICWEGPASLPVIVEDLFQGNEPAMD